MIRPKCAGNIHGHGEPPRQRIITTTICRAHHLNSLLGPRAHASLDKRSNLKIRPREIAPGLLRSADDENFVDRVLVAHVLCAEFAQQSQDGINNSLVLRAALSESSQQVRKQLVVLCV